MTVYDSAGNLSAETDYGYDQTVVGSVSGLPSGTHDETNYGSSSTAPRGNATTVTSKCLQSCSDSISKYTFDETGQVLTKIDPCGNTTCSDMSGTSHTATYSYADNYDSPPSSSTNAYLTQITDPLGHIFKFKYAYSDGQLIQSQNQNDINASRPGTTYIYNDSLRRFTETDSPDGGQTTISYNDSAPSPSVTTSKKVTTSPLYITNIATMDGMGHVVQTALTTDPDGTTYTATSYDGFGRTYKSYNPTRCNPPTTNCGETTWGFTTDAYDALGRTTSVTAPDGQVSTTAYSGSCITATDPSGKARKSCTDGLGRLIQVFEDPNGFNYETDYTYDALNNLLSVNQKGGSADSGQWRTRTFVYDSLLRLLSASNPESGTATYTYDVNGNLSAKTSPKPNQAGAATVIATYTYDVLNRLIQKSFNDSSTPTITYAYDGATLNGCTLPSLTISNGVGHRTGMCDGAGAEASSYDPMGRTTADARTTESLTKTTTYTYNLDGSLATIVYPTSTPETVTFAPGGAGRPLSATSSAIGAYASSVHYSPSGAVCYLASGWGATFYHTYLFNNRLEPTRISVITNQTGPTPCTTPTQNGNMFDISYNYVDANNHNNGNVVSIANNLNSYRSQNFTYDSLNRLATAQTSSTYATSSANCWAETYTYDAWGNLYQYGANATTQSAYTGCSQESGLSTTATVQNRLGSFTYDTAGNMISNPSISTYAYDAENHLVSTSAGGLTYLYDGDGKRVGKAPSSTPTQPTTIYWYGAGSDPLFETNGSGTFTYTHYYFNGQRVSMRTPTNWVNHYVYDALGNARIVYGQNGAWSQSDFYPFGGERVIGTGADNSFKFTGKERDSESGLDNFEARYLTSNLGRFMSPDVLGGHQEDPQTLNRYIYARNNPLNLVDPTRLDFNLTCEKESDTCHNGLVGTYSEPDDNGKRTFTATVISNDKNGNLVDQNGNQYNATVSGAGVSFSQVGSNQPGSLGVFINGTSPTTVQGTGDLTGFNFTFTYSNMASNVTAGGSWTFNGTYQDAEAALSKAGYSSWISHIGDLFDWLHPSGIDFDAVDYRSPGGPKGSNSGHFTVHEPVIQIDRFRIPVTGTVPTVGDVHLGEHNPYTGGWREHLQEVKNNPN